jgi:hypothetical protein
MKSLPRFFRMNLLAAAALFGAGGCGLSDYQSRLDAQLARLKDFDDANRLLDEPIQVPRIQLKDPKETTPKEYAGWPFDVFLRLPKGYGTAPKEKDPFNYPFPCYRYTGGNEGATNIFIAAASIQDPKAAEEQGKYHAAKFRDYVRGSLQDYYLKMFKISIAFPEKVEPKSREVKVLTAYPNPSAPVTISYKMFAYTDAGNKAIDKDKHSVFEVYLREEGSKQLCIVVQRPTAPANAAGLAKSIEACLSSLDISADAGAKLSAYKKARTN